MRQGLPRRGGQPQAAEILVCRIGAGDHSVDHCWDVDQDRGSVHGYLPEDLLRSAPLRETAPRTPRPTAGKVGWRRWRSEVQLGNREGYVRGAVNEDAPGIELGGVRKRRMCLDYGLRGPRRAPGKQPNGRVIRPTREALELGGGPGQGAPVVAREAPVAGTRGTSRLGARGSPPPASRRRKLAQARSNSSAAPVVGHHNRRTPV